MRGLCVNTKINIMVEPSVNINDLHTMCRLCLTTDVTLLDIFHFSTKMECTVANAIMTCAPVRIRKCSKMPNFICQLCYTQIEKSHQFQRQIIQSEKILRRYLKRLPAFYKQIQSECAEDILIHDTNANNLTVKSKCADDTTETLSEEDDCCEIICESTTDDIGDGKLFEDININRKKKDLANFNSENKVTEKKTFNLEIKDKLIIDDNSLISSKCAADKLETLSKASEISPENSKNHSYTCNACGKSLGTSNVHKKQNHTAVCEECFNSSINLKRVHNDEKLHKCDVCNECFSHSNLLFIHKKSHECSVRQKGHHDLKTDQVVQRDSTFFCSVCGEQFVSKNALKVHKIKHTGEKPYKCNVCDGLFSTAFDLKKHSRMHIGGKRVKCSVCEKSFSGLDSFKKHCLVHTDDQLPFKCDICNSGFPNASSFKKHFQVQPRGRSEFKCYICNRDFSNVDDLKIHYQVHNMHLILQ